MGKAIPTHFFYLLYVICASVSLSFTVSFEMRHGCVFTDVVRLWCLTKCHGYSLLSPHVNPDLKHTEVEEIWSFWLSVWHSLSSSILTPSAPEVQIKPHYQKHNQVVFSVGTSRDTEIPISNVFLRNVFTIKRKMMVNRLCCSLLNCPYCPHGKYPLPKGLRLEVCRNNRNNSHFFLHGKGNTFDFSYQ